jgi:hypothetical protein
MFRLVYLLVLLQFPMLFHSIPKPFQSDGPMYKRVLTQGMRVSRLVYLLVLLQFPKLVHSIPFPFQSDGPIYKNLHSRYARVSFCSSPCSFAISNANYSIPFPFQSDGPIYKLLLIQGTRMSTTWIIGCSKSLIIQNANCHFFHSSSKY